MKKYFLFFLLFLSGSAFGMRTGQKNLPVSTKNKPTITEQLKYHDYNIPSFEGVRKQDSPQKTLIFQKIFSEVKKPNKYNFFNNIGVLAVAVNAMREDNASLLDTQCPEIEKKTLLNNMCKILTASESEMSVLADCLEPIQIGQRIIPINKDTKELVETVQKEYAKGRIPVYIHYDKENPEGSAASVQAFLDGCAGKEIFAYQPNDTAIKNVCIFRNAHEDLNSAENKAFEYCITEALKDENFFQKVRNKIEENRAKTTKKTIEINKKIEGLPNEVQKQLYDFYFNKVLDEGLKNPIYFKNNLEATQQNKNLEKNQGQIQTNLKIAQGVIEAQGLLLENEIQKNKWRLGIGVAVTGFLGVTIGYFTAKYNVWQNFGKVPPITKN